MTFVDVLLSIFPQSTVDSLGVLVLFLFVLASLVAIIVEVLKHNNLIAAGWAGRVNGIVSLTINALLFVLVNLLGLNDQVGEAQAWLAQVTALFSSTFVTTLIAKIVYEVGKWIGMFQSLTTGAGPDTAAG